MDIHKRAHQRNHGIIIDTLRPISFPKMSASKVDSTVPDTEKLDTDTTVLPYDSDNLNDRIERAQEDARRQAEMPVKVALHKYRGAVLWSALMTLTIVMEAYDYGLIGKLTFIRCCHNVSFLMIGNLFGFPQFVRKFGTQLPNGKYNIE
jgi:SP family general alpha glucoside:H+ symporter-like MFS transporter